MRNVASEIGGAVNRVYNPDIPRIPAAGFLAEKTVCGKGCLQLAADECLAQAIGFCEVILRAFACEFVCIAERLHGLPACIKNQVAAELRFIGQSVQLRLLESAIHEWERHLVFRFAQLCKPINGESP